MASPILRLSSLKSVPVVCGGYEITVPIFLVDAFNVIHRNIGTVGLFRAAGQVKRVKLLKNAFFGDEKIPGDAPVHDVCDAVKAFFRELDEPLLTSALQNQFVLTAERISREDVKTTSIMQMVRVLSPRHRDTLAFLMWQMKKIAHNSGENKMDVSNLALVISMSIFRTEVQRVKQGAKQDSQDAKDVTASRASVIELMINNADLICSMAKRSELTPFERKKLAEARRAAANRKARMNTIVGVTDLQRPLAVKIDQVRRRSVGVEAPSKIPIDSKIRQSSTMGKEMPILRGLSSKPSARRPYQRKLDTSVMNTSDTLVKGSPVSSKISRSASDAAEKTPGKLEVPSDTAQRRRSTGQTKIKRGQPNTGLDKSKAVLIRKNHPVLVTNDLATAQLSTDLVEQVQYTTRQEEPMATESPPTPENVQPLLQVRSAEDLALERAEEGDGFADFEFRKLELLSCKDGPPASFTRSIFRHPSTPARSPARDRPSIAFVRDSKRGNVLKQAAFFEQAIHDQSTSSLVRQRSTMEKKPTVPTFTQVPTSSKRRSPTKKYQTRLAAREASSFKL